MIDKIPVKMRLWALWALYGVLGSAFVGLDIGLFSGLISVPTAKAGRSKPALTAQAARIQADRFSTYMAGDDYYQACQLSSQPTSCQKQLDSLQDQTISNMALAKVTKISGGYIFTYTGIMSGRHVQWSVEVKLVHGHPKITGLG